MIPREKGEQSEMLKRSKYALLKSNNVFVVYYRDKNLIKILSLTD